MLTDIEDWIRGAVRRKWGPENAVKFSFLVNVIHFNGGGGYKALVPSIKRDSIIYPEIPFHDVSIRGDVKT